MRHPSDASMDISSRRPLGTSQPGAKQRKPVQVIHPHRDTAANGALLRALESSGIYVGYLPMPRPPLQACYRFIPARLRNLGSLPNSRRGFMRLSQQPFDVMDFGKESACEYSPSQIGVGECGGCGATGSAAETRPCHAIKSPSTISAQAPAYPTPLQALHIVHRDPDCVSEASALAVAGFETAHDRRGPLVRCAVM